MSSQTVDPSHSFEMVLFVDILLFKVNNYLLIKYNE